MEPNGPIIGLDGAKEVELCGVGRCELEVRGVLDDPLGQDITLKSCLFDTYEDAHNVGVKVYAALQYSALEGKYGLSLSKHNQTGCLTNNGLCEFNKFFQLKEDIPVCNDYYGLMVYEKPDLRFFCSSCTVANHKPYLVFIDNLNESLRRVKTTNEKICVSYDLYSGSRFESGVSRFLLLIASVEALIQQEQRPVEEIEIIDDILCKIPFNHSSIRSCVSKLKSESIRSSYTRFIGNAVILGVVSNIKAVKDFDEAYNLRSSIMHDGLMNSFSEMLNYTEKVEGIVVEILKSKILGGL
jgi:hypothetical protein